MMVNNCIYHPRVELTDRGILAGYGERSHIERVGPDVAYCYVMFYICNRETEVSSCLVL